MERINERKALRTRFMNDLFEMADGFRTNYVKTSEIAKRLGLVFELGKDYGEALAIVNHLEGEGLIEATEEGGDVRLTHSGILEVEQAHSQPDEPTQHLAAINTINNYFHVGGSIGGSVNAPIQQASPGATQSLTVIREDDKQQLSDIVRSLRTSIDDFGLEGEDRAELEA